MATVQGEAFYDLDEDESLRRSSLALLLRQLCWRLR